VERPDKNGMGKVMTTSWQNTEEEEFDWEDMSPTLVDHSRSNGFLQPTIGFSSEKLLQCHGSFLVSILILSTVPQFCQQLLKRDTP